MTVHLLKDSFPDIYRVTLTYSKFLDMCNGSMPAPLVYLMRMYGLSTCPSVITWKSRVAVIIFNV